MPAQLHKLKVADAVCALVSFGLLTAFAAFFVGQENTFYWSDYNYYQVVTNVMREQFLTAPWQVPILAFLSTRMTHNLLFTLPLAVCELLIGHGRLQFVLALLFVYTSAYLAAAGAMVAACLDEKSASRRLAFWSTVFAGLSVPAVWVPALRGYPDMSAALALSSALLLYIYTQKQAGFSWRRLVWVGILCALAPLLRRHYAYGAIALALAIGLDQLGAPNRLKEKVATLGTIGLAGAIFMATFGALFLTNVLSCNYSQLYTSFAVSLPEALGYFFTTYGAILWLAALVGYVLAFISDTFDRRYLALTTGFSLASMLIWLATQRQLGAHYTLYFTWFVALGNGLLVFSLLRKIKDNGPGPQTLAPLVLLLILYAANFGVAFLPCRNAESAESLPFLSTRPGMLSKPLRAGQPVSYLFSANYAPFIRHDRPAVIDLARDLRRLTATDLKNSNVLVNAQSDILDVDVVRNAERTLDGDSHIPMSEVCATDSRDSFPVEMLMHSRFVVTTMPDQTLLEADRQKIILAVNRCFSENWPMAGDFRRLDKSYELEGGVKAFIYERVRETSPVVAAATLEKMRAFIGLRPGSQPRWITSGLPSAISYEPGVKNYKFDSGQKLPASPFLLDSKVIPPGLASPLKIQVRITTEPGGAIGATGIFISVAEKGSEPAAAPVRLALRADGSFEGVYTMPAGASSKESHLLLVVEPDRKLTTYTVSDIVVRPDF